MNPPRRKHFKTWLWPLGVILAAVGVAAALMLTQQPPPTVEEGPREPLVETLTVESGTHQLEIAVQGPITAARRVVIQPQVAGRLDWIHPDLEPGGVVEAGEALLRIEDDDFRLAVQEQQSRVTEADAQLRLELGRGKVAERELEMFRGEFSQDASPDLALRVPQRETARSRLDAARVALEQARLQLSRTEVTAPFTGWVEREQAALGQLVSAQADVATLVAASHFWLQVSVERERLAHIAIPGVTADSGAEVEIHYPLDERTLTRRGKVVRLLGDLSPQGRMARLLIRIDDPLRLEHPDDELRGIPLLLDSFVEASIIGPRMDNLIELPRRALHEGERAYVVEADNTLAVRDLDIVWRRRESVLVRSGLKGGERVVLSPLPFAFEGMPVRLEAPKGRVQEGGNE